MVKVKRLCFCIVKCPQYKLKKQCTDSAYHGKLQHGEQCPSYPEIILIPCDKRLYIKVAEWWSTDLRGGQRRPLPTSVHGQNTGSRLATYIPRAESQSGLTHTFPHTNLGIL